MPPVAANCCEYGALAVPVFSGLVVVMVSVDLTAVADVMLIGLVVKLSVGVFSAPDGLETMTAVSNTLPVKPFVGDMVMVELLPVLAPAVAVTAVPATEKPGPGVTVTVFEPVLAL